MTMCVLWEVVKLWPKRGRQKRFKSRVRFYSADSSNLGCISSFFDICYTCNENILSKVNHIAIHEIKYKFSRMLIDKCNNVPMTRPILQHNLNADYFRLFQTSHSLLISQQTFLSMSQEAQESHRRHRRHRSYRRHRRQGQINFDIRMLRLRQCEL